MSEIQRYFALHEGGVMPHKNGNYVSYADHVAAVEQARAEEAARWDSAWTRMQNHFTAGFRERPEGRA